MRGSRRSIRPLIERGIVRFVDGVWDPSLMRIALWRLRRGNSSAAVHVLRAKWGNPVWAADPDYLEAMITMVRIHRPRYVLECGSGLTTLVLGVLARRYAFAVISLEHDEAWAQQTRRKLERFGLPAVRVVHAPLIDRGSFHWYSIPTGLPDRFDLVVCDGPPGETVGGRLGLLPVLHDHLRGAIILLDDANRPEEQAVLEQWRQAFDAQITRPAGFDRGLAVVYVSDADNT
jgi:predicted O-methyltransferase YrrM